MSRPPRQERLPFPVGEGGARPRDEASAALSGVATIGSVGGAAPSPAPGPAGPSPAQALPERDREIEAALGAWFDRVARDLPWRRTRDPYAIWLSEVMLQQTRVETVIPYYERFLARYPTVADLAGATLDQVLSLWSGLGYYRRARVLHLAAREVTERYGGAFPAEAAGLRDLPGVGAYTAGAIASIAFDRREALVDGNVARVLARLEGIDDDIKSAAGARRLWAAAARLVPAERPGRFNQALMELGATVCTPRSPRCDACPVDGACAARAAGREEELPVISPKREAPSVAMVAAVVRAGRRVLLARRAEGGLFGGLWEPPMVEAPSLAAALPLLAAAGVGEAAGARGRGRLAGAARGAPRGRPRAPHPHAPAARGHRGARRGGGPVAATGKACRPLRKGRMAGSGRGRPRHFQARTKDPVRGREGVARSKLGTLGEVCSRVEPAPRGQITPRREAPPGPRARIAGGDPWGTPRGRAPPVARRGGGTEGALTERRGAGRRERAPPAADGSGDRGLEMSAQRRTCAEAPSAPTSMRTVGARTPPGTVMADDGALYVLTLSKRIVLDVLAYEDEGLLAFVRVDGEVVAELPVLGQA